MTEPHIIPGRRLGLGDVVTDPKTFKLGRYLTSALPAPPKSRTWSTGVTFGLYANDRIGDCGIAAPANHARAWTKNDQGVQQNITDQAVISAYSALSGYDPATGENDNGVNLLSMLRYWRRTGIGGHKIGAFASVGIGRRREVEQAIDLFGGVLIGASLPRSAAQQNADGHEWTPRRGRDGRPGSWGRHAMAAVDYDAEGVAVATWGALQWMRWDFWLACVDECYAAVSRDWLGPDGRSPGGFDAAALTADLAAL